MPYMFANPYESNASSLNTGNGWGTVQADDGWKVIGAVTTPAYKTSDLMLPVVVERGTTRTSTPRPTATRATG